MVEFNKNLWAPWRMEYIERLHEGESGCFLCNALDAPEQDERNYLLTRGRDCFVILNRFPYTGGHMLVAPNAHVGDLADLGDATMLELMQLTRRMQKLLKSVVQAEGFNVGFNAARCAGAGLPDHLHIHVVPRWPGDTNFMPVLSDARVIPETLDRLYQKLRQDLDCCG